MRPLITSSQIFCELGTCLDLHAFENVASIIDCALNQFEKLLPPASVPNLVSLPTRPCSEITLLPRCHTVRKFET